LLNAGAVIGVLIYGVGNMPYIMLEATLKWFFLSIFLSVIAYVFAYLVGLDKESEGSRLESASPRVVRLLVGVAMAGMGAIGLFVMGCVAVISLFSR
jgi:hypothetical protein